MILQTASMIEGFNLTPSIQQQMIQSRLVPAYSFCSLLSEYASINSMLDQINNCLDDLEDRNDSLNGKLHELLESNRQARVEFRAQLAGPPIKDQDEDSALSSPREQDKDIEK